MVLLPLINVYMIVTVIIKVHSLRDHWLWTIDNSESMLEDVIILLPIVHTHQKKELLNLTGPSCRVLLIKMI